MDLLDASIPQARQHPKLRDDAPGNPLKSAVGAALLSGSILTGFWVLGFETWSTPYKLNIVFHPLVSLAAAVMLMWTAIRGRIPGIGRHDAVRAAVWGLAIACAASLMRMAWHSVVADVVLLGGFWVVRRRRSHADFSRWMAEYGVYLFAALTSTGLAFVVIGGGRTGEPFLLLHRSASYALVAALVARGVAGRLRTGFRIPIARTEPPRASKIAAVVLAACVVAIFGYEWTRSWDDPYYRFHLSTYPLEKRGILEQDLLPEDFDRPELATKTNSCGGTAGCHPNLVSDLAVSAHGRSMHSRYMQKNMTLLAEEIGEHNQITCGGCHYSRMMFERDRPLSDSYGEVNYACTFCHLITDVDLWEDRRKSEIGVTLAVNHLAMFDDQGQDAIGAWDRRLIEMNPFGHARVFKKPLYRKNEYCQVCHRLQIAASPETNLAGPLCIDCHMQPRHLLGLAGNERNHIMPGTNTALPGFLGDGAGVELVRRYVAGDLLVPIKGWGSFWEPRDRRTKPNIWVLQKAMPLSEPTPGASFTLRIITVNASIDHAFPGGPLDLIETWQRVVVTDQDGNEVFRVGDLDDAFRIDPAAHRMGGRMIGDDGAVVERNRVWQIKAKIVDRAVPFRNSTTDDYTFVLPEAARALRIESQWLYRKLNQDFMDWAYPDARRTVPIVVASELSAEMPLY